MDSHGNRVDESKAGGQGPDPGTVGEGGKEVGRLYRSAMIKRGIWGSVPVEYARLQTDFPGREGWNHGWTRNLGGVERGRVYDMCICLEYSCTGFQCV